MKGGTISKKIQASPENRPEEDHYQPLAGKLMRGAAWTVSMRWSMRALGLVSTVVLARLLTPEDFGLVAMAMVFVALSQVLTDFGVELAVIRDKNAGSAELDTAWSIRLIQRLIIAAVLGVSAPFIASFYGDDRLSAVVQVIAIGIAIVGLENIGVVNFRRELDFARDFRFNLAAKLIGVSLTVIFAVTFRSYWALVLGMVANQGASVILSYILCSYRPRWSLAASKSIWGFSQWFLLQGVVNFVFERLDALVLGRTLGATALGRYSVAQELAYVSMAEIAMPVARAVGPGFAQLIDEPERIRSAFLKVFSALAIVLLPLGFGLASVATEAVPLALGGQWAAAIPLIQLFSCFAVIGALSAVTSNLLVILGSIKNVTFAAGVRSVLLMIGIMPAIETAGLMGVAVLKGVVSFIGFMALLSILTRKTGITMSALLRSVGRPGLAVIAMLGVVFLTDLGLAAHLSVGLVGLTILLFAKILAGAITYILAIYFLWAFGGRPDGLEKSILERLASYKPG